MSREAPAWGLGAAAWLAAAEVTVLIAVLFIRGTRVAPLLTVFLAIKYPFCFLLRRRSAGAFLAIALYEFEGVFSALVAPHLAISLRVLEALMAATVLGFLFVSLPAFPTVTLPESRP